MEISKTPLEGLAMNGSKRNEVGNQYEMKSRFFADFFSPFFSVWWEGLYTTRKNRKTETVDHVGEIKGGWVMSLCGWERMEISIQR